MKFLCGCESKLEIPVNAQTKVDCERYISTFDGIGHDEEGFIVCLVHRERRYGWRSVPYFGRRVTHIGMPTWTPLEHERFLLYKEIPSRLSVTASPSTVVDQRDNRDPELIGTQLRAEAAKGVHTGKRLSAIADYLSEIPAF